MCIVPQEGEEPRRTPMPHYSWTDQEATLVQTASFSSVPGGEKTNKKQKKKKAKTSAGEHFSDGPVKQSPRTCCALPRSPRGYTSRLSRGRRPLSHFTLSCKKKKSGQSGCRRGGRGATRHEEHLLNPPLPPPPCQLTMPVSLLSAPSLRNNLLLLFCFVFLYHCTFFPPLLFRRDIVS